MFNFIYLFFYFCVFVDHSNIYFLFYCLTLTKVFLSGAMLFYVPISNL